MAAVVNGNSLSSLAADFLNLNSASRISKSDFDPIDELLDGKRALTRWVKRAVDENQTASSSIWRGDKLSRNTL